STSTTTCRRCTPTSTSPTRSSRPWRPDDRSPSAGGGAGRSPGGAAMTTVGVGDRAPDFTLPGTEGTPESHRDHTLSEYAGGPVVLVFYPGDSTPVCTRQLNTYTAEIEAFREVDAQVLAISPQSIASHD